jgi:hypothetical protein
MGINTSFAHLLAQAKLQGGDFQNTLTIGRQSLTVPQKEITAISTKLGLNNARKIMPSYFADNFLKTVLGASSLTSIDYSDYQDADIVHDMNQPIPDNLKYKFDSLIDGGTIEHIFDIKQVLTNYMNFVKPGGNIFILTTANNLCGHGFYQFSPEFFYRVFDSSNGFVTEEMTLIESPLLSVEKSAHVNYFHVKDPSKIEKRIQLVNSKPTMIFIHAKKISNEEPFTSPPLQSDYSNIKWHNNSDQRNTNNSAKASENNEFEYLTPWEELYRRIRQKRKNSHRNKKFFKKLSL